MQPTVLRVEGLRDPLPPEQRAGLEAREAEPLDMRVEHVLHAAVARTGLDDFGPDDFRRRLGLLLGEVEADDNVWKASKAGFVDRCIEAAAMRLAVQDHLRRHPEIHDVEIDRPIIVVGLPRSGTTHLENLVAADRRLRHLPVFLGAEPVPLPGDRPGPNGEDARWLRAQHRWEAIARSPVMAAMHEHSPDHGCGDNELQMPDFASYQWEWLAHVPRWRDDYFAHDQTPHYEYARTLLKAIVGQFPGDQRWLLKSNQHNEQLPVLRRVYPDATIVMIHRDPVATLQSVLTMRGLLLTRTQKVPDVHGHVAYWVDRIERMLRAYLRDMDVVPDGQRVDLLFHEVMADDVGAATQVLERAGLPATDECLGDLRTYMDEHPRGRAGRVVYDIRGDFALDPDELHGRFAFYLDRFPVTLEVQ